MVLARRKMLPMRYVRAFVILGSAVGCDPADSNGTAPLPPWVSYSQKHAPASTLLTIDFGADGPEAGGAGEKLEWIDAVRGLVTRSMLWLRR